MKTKRVLNLGMAAVGIAAVLAAWPVRLSGLALSEAEGQQKTAAAVRIDNDDIGGGGPRRWRDHGSDTHRD